MELGILKQISGGQEATGAYSFRTEIFFKIAWGAPALWPETAPNSRTPITRTIRLSNQPVPSIPTPQQVLLYLSIPPFVDPLTFSRDP